MPSVSIEIPSLDAYHIEPHADLGPYPGLIHVFLAKTGDIEHASRD
jgi:hypothetical protein